jgi:hypothetical protein
MTEKKPTGISRGYIQIRVGREYALTQEEGLLAETDESRKFVLR